jgi:peptidoglycan-associated lipoprotein
MNNPTRILLAVALAASLAACKKEVKEEAPVEAKPADPAPVTQPVDDGKYTREDLNTDPCLRQRVVYFDFDRADIKAEAEAILTCHGKYLADVSDSAMTLEGHADERGTQEYNLGLGERRGNAVSQALQAKGGSAAQITVVSFGEERPTCNDSNEDCWGKNRRVEIVYTK